MSGAHGCAEGRPELCARRNLQWANLSVHQRDGPIVAMTAIANAACPGGGLDTLSCIGSNTGTL